MSSRYLAGARTWAALSIGALSTASCSVVVGLDDLTFGGSTSSASSASAGGATSSTAATAVTASGVSSASGVTSGVGGAGGGCDIAGTSVDTHYTPAQETTPGDLTSFDIYVLSPDGSGGWGSPVQASNAGDSFSLANAPCGEYLLELDDHAAPVFFDISDGNLTPDLGVAILGRTNTLLAATGTVMNMSIDGLGAWDTLDGLHLFSIGAGTTGLNLDGPLPLSAMDVNTSGPVPVSSLTPPNLISGDTVTITQITPTPIASGGHYLKIDHHAVLSDVTLSDGNSTVVTVHMQPTTQDQTHEVYMQLSKFEDDVAINGAHTANESFVVMPVPGPSSAPDGLYATASPRFVVYSPTSMQDFDQTFTWGDPFGDPHAVVGRLEVDVKPPWHVGAANDVTKAVMTVTYLDLLSQFGGAIIAPPFGPPTNITIDSTPFADAGDVSTQPKLSWSAPTGGAPDRYEIFVDALAESGSNTIATPFATYYTTKTSLALSALPPGTYGFGVIAQRSPGVDFNARPRAKTTPLFETGALSGVRTVVP